MSDVSNLLAEVEELATELAEERILHQQTIAERDEARAEADRLRDELAWMGDVAEVMTVAVKRRTEERARIVAYLRKHVGDMSARDIERGDHLKEKA